MPTKFLIHAVGSTALKVASEVKLELRRLFGPCIDERVGFLAIDAAPQGKTELDPEKEFIRLRIDDVGEILKHIDRHGVLKRELPGLASRTSLSKIQDGVHGQPIYGAFALIYRSADVRQAITAQLTRLGGDLTVLHLLSPLGGVAPGTAVRAAYLLRMICQSVLPGAVNEHHGVLILPVAGEQAKASPREALVQSRNFFFTLKQLETFSTAGTVFGASFPDFELRSTEPVFDLITCLGSNLQRDRVAQDLAEVITSASRTVSRYVAGGIDSTRRARTDDHSNIYTGTVDGKSRRLMVVGQMSLELPAGEAHRVLARRGTKSALRALVAEVESSKEARDGAREEAQAILKEIGLGASPLALIFEESLDLRPPPEESVLQGSDPQAAMKRLYEDVMTDLENKIASRSKESGNLGKIVASFLDTLGTRVGRRGTRALSLWDSLENELSSEAELAREGGAKEKEAQERHRAELESVAHEAKRAMSGFFSIFRSGGDQLPAAVRAAYKARYAQARLAAWRDAETSLRSLVKALRERREKLRQVARRSLATALKEAEPELESLAPQTIPIFEGIALDRLYERFDKGPLESLAALETELGEDLINWGSYTEEELIAKFALHQEGIFEPVLKMSAVELLAGKLGAELGIDGAKLLKKALGELVPSAKYSLACVPNETRLPTLLIVSFAAARDRATDESFRGLLASLGVRENCIASEGHPQLVTLFTYHVGAAIGMLGSLGQWRNSYERAIAEEGADVLRLYAEHGPEDLADPTFSAPEEPQLWPVEMGARNEMRRPPYDGDGSGSL